MEGLFELYEFLPYAFGGLLFVLGVLAAIRILKKTKKDEAVHFEPIGVFKDLPDTVTGLQNEREKNNGR